MGVLILRSWKYDVPDVKDWLLDIYNLSVLKKEFSSKMQQFMSQWLKLCGILYFVLSDYCIDQ